MKHDYPKLTKFNKIKDLPIEVQPCIHNAIEYLDFAYAPYSNFKVGASVLMENGELYGGSNQENASYPLCMCAERVALYHAAMHKLEFNMKCIAITAKHKSKKLIDPAMPCGACRQVIREYEIRNNSPITVYMINDLHEVFMIESIQSLLPYSFDGSVLL
jgi:cytidine deaminase